MSSKHACNYTLHNIHLFSPVTDHSAMKALVLSTADISPEASEKYYLPQ
jgi:hypothetical protein